jgi:F-type H+-transporting ATPase subunit b
MEVFPNWTTIPIIFFLILLTFILNRLFFIPIRKTIEDRHQKIEGAQKEAEEIREASRARLAEFDRRMRDARREGDLQMAQVKNAAINEKNQIVTAKKGEVEKMVSEGRAQIQQRKEEAKKTLEQESRSFAYRIASRILGRPIQQRKQVTT